MSKKYQNQKSKLQRGFTLIELLVAISIFAVFLAISSKSLVDVLNMEQKANVLRKTQQDTRYILEAIMREAKNANGEFDGQPDEGGKRIVHAYQYDPPNSITPDKAVLYSTDFSSNRVYRFTIYWDGEGTINLKREYKIIGDSDFGGLENTVEVVPLNDPRRTKVVDFSFVISNLSQDKLVPPLLSATIESVSGEDRDSGKVNLRANTSLRSSATPRSY